MATFQFSMETALQYRRMQQEQEEAKLQELVRESEHWAWQDRHVEEARHESRRLAPGLAREAVLLSETQDIYIRQLTRQHRQILLRRQDCHRRLAAQQSKAVEAQRQVKLLEKLREKAKQEWQQEQARQLEELAGDAYLAKWNRERSERESSASTEADAVHQPVSDPPPLLASPSQIRD